MPGQVLREVAYATPVGGARLLDLYLPEASDAPSPLILWSKGSGWLRDDGREGAAVLAAYFTDRGYAVAGIGVRSSAQALFPAQLHDAKAAVRWLRARAPELRLDPSRFAFVGNSSGGWVATMTALTGGVAELDEPGADGTSSGVQAAVDFFGPTDFLQMDAHMPEGCAEFRALLGIDGCHADPASPESRLLGAPIEERPDLCAQASPLTYVTPHAPPFLILHGRLDPYVPHHQSELLYGALRDAGADATFYSVPKVGHELPYVTDPGRAAGYTAVSTRGGRGPLPPPTWDAVEAFLARALAPRG